MRPSQGPKYYCRSQTSGGVPCQDPTTRFPQGAISFLPGWNRPSAFRHQPGVENGGRTLWSMLVRESCRDRSPEDVNARKNGHHVDVRAADTERSACKMIASNRGFDGIVFSPQTAEWLCWGGAWCCRKKRKTEKFPRVRVLPYLQQTSSKHSNIGRTTLG